MYNNTLKNPISIATTKIIEIILIIFLFISLTSQYNYKIIVKKSKLILIMIKKILNKM